MSHIVKYRSPDGKTDYHHTDDIHDAVSFVEQLRNDQGVDGAQIFRLEEVNFDYRPYYRVELKASEPMLSAAPAAKPAVAAPVSSAPTSSPAASSPNVAPVAPVAAPEPVVREVRAPKEESDLVSVPAAVTKEAPVSEAEPAVGARRGLFGR